MADQEQKNIAAKNEFAEELGVLVTFLDPHLKVRREAKKADSFAPWSARKCLLFFLFVSFGSWFVLLGLIYLLFLVL